MNPSIRIDPDAVYEECDVAIALGLTLTTLNKARSRGELPFVRRGRRVFFTGENLLAWLRPKKRTVDLLESVRPQEPANANA